MPGSSMDCVRLPQFSSQHPHELTYLPLAGQNLRTTVHRLRLLHREFPLATETLLHWH